MNADLPSFYAQLYLLCYTHFGSDSDFDEAVPSDLSIVEGLANKAYKVASALFPILCTSY